MKTKLFVFAVAFSLAVSFTFLTINPSVRASLKTAQDVPIPLAPVEVTNTADSGTGSLRAAIAIANQTAGTTIQFNIPNTDPNFDGKVFVIKVNSSLPMITQPTTIIDGATQTVATNNTNLLGPEIVLDGSLAPNGTDGISISTNNCTISSINIRNFFTGNGIQFTNSSRSNTVTNCYIGTDETGTIMSGNQTGIRISDSSDTNTIGGSLATGNVISGNIMDGIVITGNGSDNNIVTGNVIGVDSTVSRNQLPNLNDGIKIAGGAKGNTIGNSTSDTANTIAGNLGNGITLTGVNTSNNKLSGNFIGVLINSSARGNAQSGISIADSADSNTIGPGNSIAFNSRNGITIGMNPSASLVIRNKITRNSIFRNASLGIDLGNDGVTPNDIGDVDNGPNNLINYPVITSVTNLGNATTVVTGTVDIPSASISGAVVEIFTNSLPIPGGDGSGFGEGQTFVASPTVNAMGAFTATFTANPNSIITAVTLDITGNTSEFAANFQLGGSQADLIVNGLMVNPLIVNSGNMLQVAFNIRNQGASSASSSRQDIVLSTDAIITAQDTVLASVNTSTLAPQATMAFAQMVTIPMNTSSGQFFIGVIADAGAAVTESNETNNTASTPITVNSIPDLRVSNFSVSPTNTSPNGIVRVNFTVSNQGSADAGAHIEEVRLSKDTILGNADDILLRTEQTTLLRPSGTSRLSIDVTIPNNTIPGSYILGVIIDASNSVAEADETNNTASMTINVGGSIDLDLTNLTLTPNMGNSATQVNISFQLINRGSLNTSAVALEVRFSTDQTITSTDPLLASLNSASLNAGDNVTLTTTVTIPANALPGRSFIGIVADPANLIAESNENNNIITAAFTIADSVAPSVSLTTPNGNEIITAGGTFTIQWTSTDDIAVVSQDIFLSTDGGANFNQVIVTGLPGTATSFIWNVPSNLNTGIARIQVVVRDAVGNLGKDASDNNFIIGIRPVILGAAFKTGKLTFLVSNSNLPTSGSTLTVINGTNRETFAIGLNADGSKFVVAKKSVSTPTGLLLKQAILSGIPVMLIVTTPNGIASLPITFQR